METIPLTNRYQPWTGLAVSSQQVILPTPGDLSADTLGRIPGELIPYGAGLSLGDQCITEGGSQLVTENLADILAFDEQTGSLECGAGTRLYKILNHVVPHGWFVPATPSTAHLTVGGAVANDVHGRDHFWQGTFGNHVQELELIRKDGVYVCSREQNPALFQATIGGMGLTGMISRVRFDLKRIPSGWLRPEVITFASFDEALGLLGNPNPDANYMSLWFDGVNAPQFQRGYVLRHTFVENMPPVQVDHLRRVRLPCRFPRVFVNQRTFRWFNSLHFHLAGKAQANAQNRPAVSYQKALYQMDRIANYHKIYPGGFGQLQFALPKHNLAAARVILDRISSAGIYPLLAIAKPLGPTQPAGMMSFAMEGATFALDFPVPILRQIYPTMAQLIERAGGRIYLAKDLFLSSEAFALMYPAVQRFKQFVDPGFSSQQWRRLTKT